VLGGGCWSPWDTCRPWSWAEPVTRGAPGADLRREAGATPGEPMTHGIPGVVLCWEAGVGAHGTHAGPGAALSR
jgi:hypothetical protein